MFLYNVRLRLLAQELALDPTIRVAESEIPTSDVQYNYILVMSTAQLMQRRPALQCNNLLKKTLPRTGPDIVKPIQSLHLNFEQIVFCIHHCPYWGVVVVGLLDPFLGMGARINYAESQ